MNESEGERFPMVPTPGLGVGLLRVLLIGLGGAAIFAFVELVLALLSGDYLAALIRLGAELVIGAFAHFSWSIIQSRDSYVELLDRSMVVHFAASPWPVVSEIPYGSATLLDGEAAHSRLQRRAAWSRQPHLCVRYRRARTRFGMLPWALGSKVLHLFVADPGRLRELLAERIGRSGDVTHPP